MNTGSGNNGSTLSIEVVPPPIVGVMPKSYSGWTKGEQGPKRYDKDAAERTGFTRRTVEQIRERCVTEGLPRTWRRH